MAEGDNSILLNDDCLLAVFRFFDVKDLMRMALVTKQFRRVAQEAFRMKYKKIKLHEHCPIPSKKWLKCIFSNFGNVIDDLTISAIQLPPMEGPMEKGVLRLIEKYCNKGNSRLRALRLEEIRRGTYKIQSVLEHLHVLELVDISLPFSIGFLLNKLQSVKEVKIIYCSPSRLSIEKPQLIPNQSLKRLALKNREELSMLEILSNIDTMYPEITHLRFEAVAAELFEEFCMNIHKIANLKNLLSLDVKMRFHDPNILLAKIIENDSQLKILKLHQIKTTGESMKSVCKMKTLEELYLFNIIGENLHDLLNLAKDLENLRVLSAYMNEITIRNLIQIIYRAKNLTHIEFSMSDDDQWNSHNFWQLESVIKNQNRGKITLMMHRRGIRTHPMIGCILREKCKGNPYVELCEKHFSLSSVFG